LHSSDCGEKQWGRAGEGGRERNTEVLLDACRELSLKYDTSIAYETHVKEEKFKQRFDRKI
jgi:hypothetical protein